MRACISKTILEIIKLTTKPPNIIHPVPLLVFLIYSQSEQEINSLISATLFSLLFYSAVNLWNHINDIEEDRLAGKNNIFIINSGVRKSAVVLVITMFILSFVSMLTNTKDRTGIMLFLAVFIVTWIYSDKMFFGRFIRRWKEHYITEVLTFIIAVPTYTLLIWTFFDELSFKAIALATSMTFLILSGTFLKDLRDITGDELAGLKTLGVVFKPKTLLKFSTLMVWIYYITILLFIYINVYNQLTIFVLAPWVCLIYSTAKFIKSQWRISPDLVEHIRLMVYSSILSVILFVISGLLSQSLQTFQFH